MKKTYILFNCFVVSILLTFCSCSRQKGINDILIQAENIVEQQPDSALRLLNTVLFPEDLSKSLFNKYNLLMIQAKDKSYKDITSDTIVFTVKDYYVQKNDYPDAALAAFYCGRVRHEQKNMEEAVKEYMEAENLAGKTNNYNLKGLIQANWGILHLEHSSYEKAIELIKNAVVMYDKAQNYKNKISALRSIGNCFALNKQIDSAFYYYNESLKLADSCNMPKLQSDVRENMGVVYREQGFYEQSKKFFNEALALPNDSLEQVRILLNIAYVHALEDNIDSVNFYLDKALALKVSDPWLIRSSYLLKSNLAEKNNRYQDALSDYKEYYNYTKKVFDNEKNNKLLEIQGKYDIEKLKNLENQLIIKQKNAVIILSFALLIAGIIIFIYYRRAAQSKRILLETEQKIESLEKMADNFSKENHSFRNILIEQFGILKKTALIKESLDGKEQVNGQRLLKKFNEIVYGKDAMDWDKLFQIMDNLKNGLYGKIRNQYPRLKDLEFHVCCLSCEADFTDKEIMIILGTTLNMVRRTRSDLRKKFGMSKGEDFLAFFKNTIQ